MYLQPARWTVNQELSRQEVDRGATKKAHNRNFKFFAMSKPKM